jgi:hypothetical protein
MKKLTLIIFAISVVGCSYEFNSSTRWDPESHSVSTELLYYHQRGVFSEVKKNAREICENKGKERCKDSFKGYQLQHLGTAIRKQGDRGWPYDLSMGFELILLDMKSLFRCTIKRGPKPCVKIRSDYVGGGGS